VVRDAAAELAGRCVVVQVNTEDNPGLVGRFTIHGIPAIVLLVRGKVIDSISGALDKGALLAWYRRHIG
jgi:thioredoxin 2